MQIEYSAAFEDKLKAFFRTELTFCFTSQSLNPKRTTPESASEVLKYPNDSMLSRVDPNMNTLFNEIVAFQLAPIRKELCLRLYFNWLSKVSSEISFDIS